jgi:replicative DNA helicase
VSEKTNGGGMLIDVNVDNEQVVLGALILDAEAFKREAGSLRPEWFNHPRHRSIAKALRELRRSGASYAADTLVQVAKGEVELTYLRKLESNFSPLPEENLSLHLIDLRRDAAKFAASEDLAELYASLDDRTVGLEETQGHALSIVKKLREAAVQGTEVKGGRALHERWMRDLRESREGKSPRFVPLRFTGLDEHLYAGLKPGDLIVVAARPGMGKSTFCSNLTLRQVLSGRRVLNCPLEAGTDSVVDQMLCARARVEAEKLVKTPEQLTNEEVFRLERAARELLDPGLVTFDDELMSIDDLELRVEEGDYTVVILDLFEYLLQGELKPAEVTAALRRLKRLGKRRRFATVVVQQIRRIKRTKNPRPRLDELKNSGGYEEVGDLILLLHRSKYYDPESADEDVMEVKVAKQRRGPQNLTAGFLFEPGICRVGAHTTDFDGRK